MVVTTDKASSMTDSTEVNRVPVPDSRTVSRTPILSVLKDFNRAELVYSSFYFMKDTFNSIPIPMCDVLESEPVAMAGRLYHGAPSSRKTVSED